MKKLDTATLSAHKGKSFVGVGTVFLCHDGNGKFLMSKRSMNCRDEKGKWEVPGGRLKWGVTIEDNLRREVKEELDADIQDYEYLGMREVFRKNESNQPTHWIMLDYLVLVHPKQVKVNEPDKADAIGWFTLTNQPEPLHSQHQTMMKKYAKRLNSILD